MSNICSKCGSEFNSAFCPNCGTPAQKDTPMISNTTHNLQQPIPVKKNIGCLNKIIGVIGFFTLFILFITIITQFTDSAKDTTNTSKNNVNTSENEESIVYVNENEIPYIYTDTNKYKGKHVKLTGKVFIEPERDEDGVYFQMYQNVQDSENNTLVAFLGDSDVKLDDFVIIDGVIKDEYEGTNAFGGTITAPRIIASSVKISSYQEIVAPTEKALDLQVTQEQYGYEIVLEKVEFAEKETRVYFTINNNGSSNFSAYPFNIKIIQGQKQYEEQDNWDANYPEIQTDLYPGTSTSGIVCFPSINQTDNFTLLIDASSDDWNEDIQEYKFDVSSN